MNKHGCVIIKLYLQKEIISQIGLLSLTSDLDQGIFLTNLEVSSIDVNEASHD